MDFDLNAISTEHARRIAEAADELTLAKLEGMFGLVRVVRCADCRFCTEYGSDSPVPGFCRRFSRALFDFDGYCSWGETTR